MQLIQQNKSKLKNGFSLVELMVVVSIMGILSALAYPAYGQYMQRSRRMEAQLTLLQYAGELNQYFYKNRSYIGAPTPASTDYYTFQLIEKKSDYSVAAIPTELQAGDRCSTLYITHSGEKYPSDCW